MSNTQRVQQQVFAAIVQSGLIYSEQGEFLDVLAPPFEGSNQSTLVRVRSSEHSNGKIVVYMVAPVVINLPEPQGDSELSVKAHLFCNRLNQDQIFGRWVYYPGRGEIVVEHELVGEDLDPSELIGTVTTVGHAADSWDDALLEELGAGELALADDSPSGTTT